MKCPLCENDYTGTNADKQLHAHMMKSHMAEYRAKGCKISAFGIKKEPSVKADPPDDFRLLDLTDSLENAAYKGGYRYFAGEQCYTSAECKKLGWIS